MEEDLRRVEVAVTISVVIAEAAGDDFHRFAHFDKILLLVLLKGAHGGSEVFEGLLDGLQVFLAGGGVGRLVGKAFDGCPNASDLGRQLFAQILHLLLGGLMQLLDGLTHFLLEFLEGQ